MSIKTFIQDNYENVLGSWVNPFKVALFGRGAGDYHSPGSFTATKSGPSTLTLSGLTGITITNSTQFRAVRAYNASGGLVAEYFPCAKYGFRWDATESKLHVMGADWSGAERVEVELAAEPRAYSSSEDAYQDYQVNPAWAYTQESDTTATGQGDGTKYAYFDMDGYKYAGFQILDTPGTGDQTYTIEGSWEDNGTAQASCDYADLSSDWLGVASITSADITASAAAGVIMIDTPLTCKFIRIKIVRANDAAATDGAWDIHMRGTY